MLLQQGHTVSTELFGNEGGIFMTKILKIIRKSYASKNKTYMKCGPGTCGSGTCATCCYNKVNN